MRHALGFTKPRIDYRYPDGDVSMMPPKTLNAIPELVDLRIRVQRANDQDGRSQLHADLRVGRAEIEDERTPFDVQVKRLTLDLGLEGFLIAPATRFGEPIKENVVRVKRTATSESSGKATFGGTLSLKVDRSSANPSIGADVTGTRETSTNEKIEHTSEEVFFRVRAIPNDRWEIREPNGTELSATYLNDDKLCELEPIIGANWRSLCARIICNQRDLSFDFKGVVARLTTNKSRLLGVVVAKAISNDRQYKGRLILSQVEHLDEG